MKKIALATVAAAAMAATGGAHAYTSGTFSNGFVVPNVIHNGSTQTTAVGIINRSGRSVPVYWSFFDQDSVHITDGCFAMTEKQYTPFNWMEYSGGGLADVRGYLTFAVGQSQKGVPLCKEENPQIVEEDNDGPFEAEISANAFFVDTGADDVAFTPVIDGPLVINSGSLNTMDADSLVYVDGAAQVGWDGELHMRYTMAGSDQTLIMVWSTGSHKGEHTVLMYDDQQNRKSVNFKLDHRELDGFDPGSLLGLPDSFKDGFIIWDTSVPAAEGGPLLPWNRLSSGGSVYSFSYVNLGGFGAQQTLLASHRDNGGGGS